MNRYKVKRLELVNTLGFAQQFIHEEEVKADYFDLSTSGCLRFWTYAPRLIIAFSNWDSVALKDDD